MTQSVYRSFTQRLLLLMLMMVMGIGGAWGETTEIHKYIKWDQTSAVFNVSDAYTRLGKTLSELKEAHRIDWYVLDGSSVKQTLDHGSSQKSGVWTFSLYHSWEFWPYAGENSNTSIYLDNNTNYWSQGDLETGWTSWNLSTPTIYAPSEGTFETYKDYGREKWDIYANVVNKIYSEIGGFKQTDIKFRDRIHYYKIAENGYYTDYTDK